MQDTVSTGLEMRAKNLSKTKLTCSAAGLKHVFPERAGDRLGDGLH